ARRAACVLFLLAALLPSAPAGAGTRSTPPAAQQLNTIGDVFKALRACWIPPPPDRAQEGMEITVRFSFTREGAILGEPRFTYLTHGVREDVRVAYQRAVVDTLNRCTPLPFSPALGASLAGRPFAIRFVDNRSLPGART